MSIKLLHEQIITKTGNDHKQPQTTSKRPQITTNHQQTTTTHRKPTSKRPQTTTNGFKSLANDYKLRTNEQNGHTCISNQTSDVSLYLLAPGNHKEHHDFENHTCVANKWGGRGGGRGSE